MPVSPAHCLGDYASNDADWARMPTLLNAESRGIHGRIRFLGTAHSLLIHRFMRLVQIALDPSVTFGNTMLLFRIRRTLVALPLEES
jgi:hypothetical protein